MMRLLTNNPLTNALLCCCCLLLLILTLEWLLPYRAAATANADSAPGDVELADNGESPYVHPHIDQFSEILKRPIFFQSRELPAEAVAESAAPRAPLRLELEGIAIVSNARIAVLRDQANKRILQLSIGMSHNDWLVEDITAEGAAFRRGDDVTQLTLKTDDE